MRCPNVGTELCRDLEPFHAFTHIRRFLGATAMNVISFLTSSCYPLWLVARLFDWSILLGRLGSLDEGSVEPASSRPTAPCVARFALLPCTHCTAMMIQGRFSRIAREDFTRDRAHSLIERSLKGKIRRSTPLSGGIGGKMSGG